MPNLKLNVQIARSSTLLTRLRKGELCMAILAEVDGLEEFRTRVIYEDRMAVFARRDLVTSSVHSSGPSQGDESRRLLEALGVGVLAPGQEGHPRYMSQFLKTLPANVPVKVSSDSLEALAYCASQGSIAACLPVRVGTRSDLNLVEVPSITAASGKFSGSHKILLVSHKNCDSAEFEFLFREVSAV